MPTLDDRLFGLNTIIQTYQGILQVVGGDELSDPDPEATVKLIATLPGVCAGCITTMSSFFDQEEIESLEGILTTLEEKYGDNDPVFVDVVKNNRMVFGAYRAFAQTVQVASGRMRDLSEARLIELGYEV